MGLALVSILWAYDGWADLSFASGEVKDPQGNLPRAIILGTLAIIGIYLTDQRRLPIRESRFDTVAQSPLVAADTMFALFGRAGVVLVSMFVMISSFSSLNGSMLASPRVFFAMADDGLFFETIARVHPRYQTPYVAILLAAVLGMALVLSRSFEALTDTFVLAIWPFYALGVAAIYPPAPHCGRICRGRIARSATRSSRRSSSSAVAAFVDQRADQRADVRPTLTFALILAGLPVYAIVFRRRAPRDLTIFLHADHSNFVDAPVSGCYSRYRRR